jgi:excinuclease ABC subunit C
LGKRGCLYSHIGLCNPCPNIIERETDKTLANEEKRKYLKNIRNIKSILDGKIGILLANLTKEMTLASKGQDFELAGKIRDQIQRIEYITRPQMPTEFYMQNPNLYEDTRKKELMDFRALLEKTGIKVPSLSRIECFDVAHLAGTNATASMVTFIDGEADKTYYRHFRIRQTKSQSDIDSLREVISRRLGHLGDWGTPSLIVVDGGVAQVNAFDQILKSKNTDIPVVGIAKNPDRLITGIQKIRLVGNSLHLLSRMRDEAHRFARSYHHKLISDELRGKNL